VLRYTTGPKAFPGSRHHEADRLNGRDRIEKRLGQGGMGAVYKAYDSDLDKFVAAKCLLPEFSSDAKAAYRLKEEVTNAQDA
jgi:serine/threonine protein kinase